MNKYFYFFFLVLMISNLNAQPDKAIMVNPLGLFWGVMNVQYEFKYKNENSIALRANFVGYDIGSFSNSAFGLGGSYRWYSKTRPVVGLWYGPSADLLFWSAKEKNRAMPSTYRNSFLGIGGDIGYKWNFNQFGLEIFGGLRYYFGEIAGLSFGGVSIIGGVSLGYLWK
ncbi:MAG: DUF3575 domain-containing protein [Ignavibacteria bacterium]|nr:DUF3575 domain-containing protein [Ignavibacteria bacterium]